MSETIIRKCKDLPSGMRLAIAVVPKDKELTLEDIYKAYPEIRESREKNKKELL